MKETILKTFTYDTFGRVFDFVSENSFKKIIKNQNF